jgi:diguanylate cyclase (GGDEF)-like protein/PAS domain S-box-containing protein
MEVYSTKTTEPQIQELLSSKKTWLRAQQIELLFDKSYISLIATVLSAIALVYIIWLYEPRTLPLVWLVVTLLITLCRSVLLYLYYHSTSKNEQQNKWLAWFTFGVFMSGLNWGIGGILFSSFDSTIMTAITLLILGSLVVASIIAYAAVVSTFLAFSLPLVTPIACLLIIKGDSVTIAIGVMVFVFLGLMLLYAMRLNKTIMNMFELQFDNAELVSKLDKEKSAVEERIKEKTKDLSISENKFASAFRSSPDMIAIIRKKDGVIIEINSSYEHIIGFKHEELIGKSMFELGIWRDANDHSKLFKAISKNGCIRHWNTDLITRSGEIRYCEISAEIATINDEECIIAVTRDVTKRRKIEINLKDSESRFRNIFEYAPIGIVLSNVQGNILQVNEATCEIVGYQMQEIVGKNFFDFAHPDEMEINLEHLRKLHSGDIDSYRLEKRYLHKKGHYIWVSLNVSLVRDQHNTASYLIAQVEDISKAHKLTEQLSYEATHDSLTKLINRAEFEKRLKRVLKSSSLDQSEHALCYLDLDQFKVVNDTCGHIAGDELLRQLSSVLKDAVRKRDTLARLGGDEFGILMEHCSIEDANRATNSIQEIIQNFQFSWEGHYFKIRASIGLVAITANSHNLTDILRDADAACYIAKDKGRNRIHVYHAQDSEIAERHGEMQWVARLHQALEDDRFCLYAQAIVPLDNRLEKHYELLIRMFDGKGDTIPPGAFLPAAERYSLITAIDRWVIERAFTLMVDHPAFCNEINFCSINLSGLSMAESDFLQFVITQLEKTGLDGNKICFEITETAAISNLNMATNFISTLKKLGCHFALDDFGSGLSSFAYLKNLPVDYLKIDGMFVKDIVDDPIDHAMVKSINEIGQVMGMQTIAEFVENDKIKVMLKEIGVNYAQGYGIGKPQPLDELLTKVNNVTDIKYAKQNR